jgi:DNA-binding transcriptional MerR regulator
MPPQSAPDATPDEAALTIDQLAAASGFTARTIRSYTTRGLLPPPRLRGRTGLYDQEHLSRLSAVRHMLDDGFTLAAAEQLLATAPEGVTSSGLDVYRALLNPWEVEEPPEILTRETTEALLGVPLTEERFSRLVDLGLLAPSEDDSVTVVAPSLLRAGQQLTSLGLHFDAVLGTQAELSRHAVAMAQACITLFKNGIWDPFEEAGRPESGWPDVRSALDRTLPIASQAVLVTFHRALALAIAETIEQEQAANAGTEPGPAPDDDSPPVIP